MLKKIEAIIREDKVNDVKDALYEIGIVGLNMFEVRGHGRQGGIKLVGRAGTYQINMLPKIQINIVLSDRNLEDALEAILNSAHTGEPGDGLILSIPWTRRSVSAPANGARTPWFIPATSIQEKERQRPESSRAKVWMNKILCPSSKVCRSSVNAGLREIVQLTPRTFNVSILVSYA